MTAMPVTTLALLAYCFASWLMMAWLRLMLVVSLCQLTAPTWPLLSKPFCEPGTPCRSSQTLMPCFVAQVIALST